MYLLNMLIGSYVYEQGSKMNNLIFNMNYDLRSIAVLG